MHCPDCGNQHSRVRETRSAEEGASVRRRRECSSCGHRFTTFERYERGPLFVRKRDGGRQPFDREKLRGGLARAAHKRPLEPEQIEAIVAAIEAEAERSGGELPAARIGEMCLEGLRLVDRIAYLQFAAVYKQLEVEEVRREIDSLPQFAGSGDSGSVRGVSDPA